MYKVKTSNLLQNCIASIRFLWSLVMVIKYFSETVFCVPRLPRLGKLSTICSLTVKQEFHGTDTDTYTNTDIRDAPIV